MYCHISHYKICSSFEYYLVNQTKCELVSLTANFLKKRKEKKKPKLMLSTPISVTAM